MKFFRVTQDGYMIGVVAGEESSEVLEALGLQGREGEFEFEIIEDEFIFDLANQRVCNGLLLYSIELKDGNVYDVFDHSRIMIFDDEVLVGTELSFGLDQVEYLEYL